MRQLVGVDNEGAQAGEHASHGALARADSPGNPRKLYCPTVPLLKIVPAVTMLPMVVEVTLAPSIPANKTNTGNNGLCGP